MIPWCTYGYSITIELWWFQCDELTHCNFLSSVHWSLCCIQHHKHANSCMYHAHNASVCVAKLVTSDSPEHSDLHGRLNKPITLGSTHCQIPFRVLFIHWLTHDKPPNCISFRALIRASGQPRQMFWIYIFERMNLKWKVFKYSVLSPLEINFASVTNANWLLTFRKKIAFYSEGHRKQTSVVVFCEHIAEFFNFKLGVPPVNTVL
jgi:hypothetical protein